MSLFATRDELLQEANARLQFPVPEFALTSRKLVIDQVLSEPDLVAYIEDEAAGDPQRAEQLRSRARQYAEEIGPKFSPFFYFRVAFYLARGWLRLHYQLRSTSTDVELEGVSRDATIVLVSNHRSNFDPLLITYMALRYSTVGLSAGEWARLWPLHHFVRAAGGFVVDRDARDPLYRHVLGAYVRRSVASGVHQAFFPEGELSRDGRAGTPKLGFLNFYCRACSEDRDIVFIPTGINYDRIPEDRRLCRAEGSFENPKATFLIGAALRYLASVATLPFRRRSRRYGNACVAFGAPVSLREWLTGRDIDIVSLNSPERYHWLPALAEELMQRCQEVVPAPPVPILAILFCRVPDKDIDLADVKKRMQDLAGEIQASGANLQLPDGIDAACESALDLLVSSGLVRRNAGGLYRAVPAELPVLDHYANSIGHLLP